MGGAGSESGQYQLANGSFAFDEGVGALEVLGVDEAEAFGESRADATAVGEPGDLAQDLALARDVGRAIQAARVHEFPVQREALALELHDVQIRKVVDQSDSALGRQRGDDVIEMFRGVGQGCRELDARDAERLKLRQEGLAVVDHRMGAELGDPVRALGPRGRGDDLEPCKLTSELDQDGADPACAADDQKALAFAALAHYA